MEPERIEELLRQGLSRNLPERMRGRIMERVVRERARLETPASKPFAQRLKSRTLAGTLSILVLALVGVLLFRQQPITAAQILEQSQTAASRLTSWHFKYKTSQNAGPHRYRTYYTEEWYSAPNERRCEESAGGALDRPWTKLIRGNEELLYDPYRKVANFRALTKEDEQHEAENYEQRSFQLPDGTGKRRITAARILGTERALGRLCDVVTGNAGHGLRLRMAVDRETRMPLRSEYFRSDATVSEKTAVFTVEMTVFQPNKAIAEDVFRIKLPRDVLIIHGSLYSPVDGPIVDLEQLEDPAVTENQMRLALAFGANLKAAYKPAYIPAGYKLQRVYYDLRYASLRADGSGSRPLNAYYISPKTGGSLLLVQSATGLDEGTKVVSAPGFEGRISSFTEPYPYSILTWAKGGTYLALVGSMVSRPELLKVAERVKPLGSLMPGLGTGPTWRITARVLGKTTSMEVKDTLDFVPEEIQRRFRTIGVFDATVARTGRDRLVITARAEDPGLIGRLLVPGYVSFVPIPKGLQAENILAGSKPLITQDDVHFSDRVGARKGQPLYLSVRLRYPFLAPRLENHDGPHAKDTLAIVIDNQRVVATVTKGGLISGTRIGPLPPDAAAILATTPLDARLKVVSKERS